MGGDVALFREILADYLKELKEVPEQLAAHMREGDMASAHRLVHTLKGTSASVGALPMSNAAKAAEVHFKSPQPDIAAEALLGPLRAEVTATLLAMADYLAQAAPTTGADKAAP
jgi:HPt (histidine-containing phosphotransfer) domain-containing protein